MRYLTALILAAAMNSPALASTITVTNTSDAGAGSLRQALAAAAPGDTIEFAVEGTITLASRLTIDRNVRITGPGAERLAISGAGDFAIRGIVAVTAGASEISGVTLMLGRSNACGGAIRVEAGATLQITDSTLRNNGAFLQGGALCNHGSLTVIRCHFESNAANVAGGNLYNDGGMFVADSTITKGSSNAGGGVAAAGPTVLVGVTIANNTAIFGGGLHSSGGLTDVRFSSITGNLAGSDGGGAWQDGGQMNFLNTTISSNQTSNGSGGGTFVRTGTLLVQNSTYFDNFAWVSGGGIYINLQFSNLDVTHATIAKNRTLGTGGGLYSPSAFVVSNSLNMKNTILAGQFAGGNCAVPGGTGISGFNLSDDDSCATLLAHFSDRHSTPAGLDPLGLRDNGGPTKTLALVAGSAAIDAVPLAFCNYIGVPVTIDQRNLPRPFGPACDTGAVETDAPVEPPDVTPPTIHVPDDLVVDATSPQGAVVTFDVSASDPDDAAGPVTCSPESGSLFPFGTTAVTCAATDTHGNRGTAAFTVTVLAPSQTIADVTTASAAAGLQQTSALLQNALAAATRGNVVSACNQLGAVESQIRAHTGKGIAPAAAAALLSRVGNARSGLGCR